MKEATFEYAEDIISKAMMFAISAHSGQFRKDKRTPAIIHAMEACTIVATLTHNQEVMAAALLHDTVEDTDVTIEQITTMFGNRIARLVSAETENKRPEMPPSDSWQIRKQESIEELYASTDIEVKYLWLGDKLSNMRSFYRAYLVQGDKMFEMFNCTDKKKHEWYYRSIANATAELINTPAHQEYCRLLNYIFGEENNE